MHAELARARRAQVRVVREELHAESREPLGGQRADPSEPDNAHRLAEQLDAAVLAALPLAVLQRLVGGRDVAGRRQQQTYRQLGSRGDVGSRGIHNHDAGHCGGLDVHVVQTHSGTGDDLEAFGRSQRLLVDLGGRTDQYGVDVSQRATCAAEQSAP